MASRPDEPPESIVLGTFSGLNNKVTPERLRLGELEKAVNVDIDDAGQLHRRRGFVKRLTGDYHSLYEALDFHLVVENGVLGTIDPGYVFSALATVGSDPLSYVEVGDTVYFASRSASGKIVDLAVLPWGQTGGSGEWLSPVVAPTDTLGAVSGKLLGPPPLASIIEAYKGRIYLASDKWIWVTELYLYDKVDRTKGVIPIEHEITLMMAMTNGIFIGTVGGLYFLSGVFSEGQKLEMVSASPVVPGSGTWVPAGEVHPAQRQGSAVPEGDAAVFMTENGICAGFGGGEVYNLTHNQMVFPAAASAAALFRDQDGVKQYVAVANSAGGPSSTARIGDYVDAEIRRFQGG